MGRQFQRRLKNSWSFKFCIYLILFSLALGATNHLDKGSVEASSPEDQLQKSLPSFDPAQGLQGPDSLYGPREKNDPEVKTRTVPILTPNVFPYQPNPIAAVVAAGLTLAFVSLKETGRVDTESILWLLNNSDYYAGLLGSIVNAQGQKATAKFIANALARGLKRSPTAVKGVFDSQAVKIFGNIVNGFTYTLAVSAGFEVFSQFWKYATRNIPEAQTMTGLLKSSTARKKQVIQNLLYQCILDGNMQKRLLNSVYNHRVMTYEFIATNVAMFAAGFLTTMIVKKYGAGHPLLQKVAPVIASIGGGIAVQMVPDSWKSSANRGLIEWRIERNRRALEEALKRVDEYMRDRIYPAEEREFGGYLMSGISLPADLDRVFRARDMLNSLEYELMVYMDQPQSIVEQVRADQARLSTTFDAILQTLESAKQAPLQDEIDRWVKEKRTPEEIAKLAERYRPKDPQGEFYEIVIRSAIDRTRIRSQELEGLFAALNSPVERPNVSDEIFDMATSNQ